jgi:hypothetical protein
MGFIGTAKVVPCYKTGLQSSFSSACEVVPFQNINDHLYGGHH